VKLRVGIEIKIHGYVTNNIAVAAVVYIHPDHPRPLRNLVSESGEHLGCIVPPDDWEEAHN
jgi:hypothetical protein